MRKIALPVTLAASLLALGVTVAQASAAAASIVYVSPSGTSGAADTSCSTAAYSDINAAITASSSGGTVVVCRGTYDGEPMTPRPL
jgi:polygalacturonase